MENVAERLIARLTAKSLKIVTAESCTGGLLADSLVQVPGASQVFWGGFVTYSVVAKRAILGLDEERIHRYGLVSAEIAGDMAEAALVSSDADVSVSITGLAGPESDGSATPVGTVWIGVAVRGKPADASLLHYCGSRNEIRLAATQDALNIVLERLDKSG
jgi:PncC family amidohydrolase